MSTRPDFRPPRLLALDLGGVLLETQPSPNWSTSMARHLVDDATRTPGPANALPEIAQVAADLRDGRRRHDDWKELNSDGIELSQPGLWEMLSRREWGPDLLRHVTEHRVQLTAQLCLTWEARELRPGVHQLLDWCQGMKIAVCVVSNTISGRAYRTVLDRSGLGGRFVGLSFSDEVGIRKPDPRLLLHALRTAGFGSADAWYVGDTHRRDVACARRAGVAAVLMRSRRTEPGPADGPLPDAVVDDHEQLLALLKSGLRTTDTAPYQRTNR